jgi:hypothetical protein
MDKTRMIKIKYANPLPELFPQFARADPINSKNRSYNLFQEL